MKISTKTLNAAKKAAESRGMSLDAWAEQALAEAAATADNPTSIAARLRQISEKIDRLADRPSLGDQLAGAVQGLGDSYQRAKKGAGQLTGDAVKGKAGELLERVRASASDFVGPITLPPEEGRESGEKRTARKSAQKAPRKAAKKATKPTASKGKSASDGRRSTAARKPKRQPSGS